MRRVVVQQAGAGVSGLVPIDEFGTNLKTSLAIIVDSGVIDATVEYTLEDVENTGTPADGFWFQHSRLTNRVSKAVGTLIGAVSAVRLRNAGTGTARLVVLQASS
jgi:hypothetical protein